MTNQASAQKMFKNNLDEVPEQINAEQSCFRVGGKTSSVVQSWKSQRCFSLLWKPVFRAEKSWFSLEQLWFSQT